MKKILQIIDKHRDDKNVFKEFKDTFNELDNMSHGVQFNSVEGKPWRDPAFLLSTLCFSLIQRRFDSEAEEVKSAIRAIEQCRSISKRDFHSILREANQPPIGLTAKRAH